MSYRILIDMDGCTVNFVNGVLKLYNKENPYKEGTSGSWDMFPLIQESEKDFWETKATREFWASLEKTPECDEIMSLAIEAVGEKNVAFCTSPPWSPWARSESVAGKSEWIMRNYPSLKKNIIFTSVKEFCANENTLLIDDANHNYEPFVRAGGFCCLVPRPWNNNYYKNPIDFVKNEIGDFLFGTPQYKNVEHWFSGDD